MTISNPLYYKPSENGSVTLQSSFRDPSGFLFYSGETLLRQINTCYKAEYDLLMTSGLYDHLCQNKLLVPHEEVPFDSTPKDEIYKVIRPQKIKFVSYPYEWSFSQLKDAGLLTLEICRRSIEHGMILKDASAYNVQFHAGTPVLIDTLSFDTYQEGYPWVAYRQFCQHFLAPLALMAHTDYRLSQLFRIYIDGLPLDLTSTLLPSKTWFSFSLMSHIHLHAKSQKRFANINERRIKTKRLNVSKRGLLGLIDSLQRINESLKSTIADTEWCDYYDQTNYTHAAFEDKINHVSRMVNHVSPQLVWDLGANTGVFSEIAAAEGAYVISWDIDAAAVEKNYLSLRQKDQASILPLLLDLTNPSAGIGWANSERDSLEERGPADLVMALAVIHHLAISNNVPLQLIAKYFSRLGKMLLIEFVPKTDSQVKRLLATRRDIFNSYNQEKFEMVFDQYCELIERVSVKHSERTLYLYRPR
jgi:hypothetical protein